MRETIANALRVAMRAKDQKRVQTIRLIQAAIKDRDIVARGQGHETVGDDIILDILAKMVKQREESEAIYAKAGRDDLASQERHEITIIRDFMPAQLDENDIRQAVAEAVIAIDAQGLRDMGRVMAWLKENYAGQMDFAKASAIAREALG
jgi:uncharacterized protein